MSETYALVLMGVIGIGILLCAIRFFIGHTASDRVVAVDTACTVTTALLVFVAYYFRRYIYLDVAFVYAVLMFIGVVAIARFLERGI